MARGLRTITKVAQYKDYTEAGQTPRAFGVTGGMFATITQWFAKDLWRLLDVLEDAVQLIQAVVVHHQSTLALAGLLQLNLGTQALA